MHVYTTITRFRVVVIQDSSYLIALNYVRDRVEPGWPVTLHLLVVQMLPWSHGHGRYIKRENHRQLAIVFVLLNTSV